MAVGVQKAWSTTAASNGTADTNVNFAEGQLMPTLNNSSRALMAAVRGWANQIQGGCTSGGSSNAYTITSDSVAAISSAYAAGMMFMLKANHTNSGAATLDVDGVGAVAIKTNDGGDVVAGDIVQNGLYLLVYNSTGPRFDLIGTIAGGSFQPLDPTTTAFAALSFSTTNSFLRATNVDTFTAEDAAAHRTALGLGTAALKNTGTSGNNVPLLDGVNEWGAVQRFGTSGDNGPKFNSPYWAWMNAAGTRKAYIQAVAAGTLTIQPESDTVGVRINVNGGAATVEGDTIATLTASQSLSNKTLSSPTLSGTVTPSSLIFGGNFAMSSSSEIQFFSSSYSIRASTGLELKTADSIRFLVGSTEIGRVTSAGIQIPVAISSETTGTLTSASRNKQLQLTGGITMPNSVFSAGDMQVIDPGTSSQTITRGSGIVMYVNGTDSASATVPANHICGAVWRSSSVCVLTGPVS